MVFQNRQIDVQFGDAIVLYSDGLLDIQLEGGRVDEEWLSQIVRSDTETAANQIVDRVTETLERLELPRRDDVAIMALSRPFRRLLG